jgi:hypothetical protein
MISGCQILARVHTISRDMMSSIARMRIRYFNCALFARKYFTRARKLRASPRKGKEKRIASHVTAPFFPDEARRRGSVVTREHACACIRARYGIPSSLFPSMESRFFPLLFVCWRKISKHSAWKWYRPFTQRESLPASRSREIIWRIDSRQSTWFNQRIFLLLLRVHEQLPAQVHAYETGRGN